MSDLPLKFILKLAKIPLYVGMAFMTLNIVLILFTAIRVNTIAHTAMLVINENNFMPAHERLVIVQELANMGRPFTNGARDRQNLPNPAGIVQDPKVNAGSPIVGGWTETFRSLQQVEARVQHGVVSEFEMFVWFRPYIPIFGNLAVRGYDGVNTTDGNLYGSSMTDMKNQIGVVGGQDGATNARGDEWTVTNDQGMFAGSGNGSNGSWNWQIDANTSDTMSVDHLGRAAGLQSHLDAERSWFDFRIGGCYRAVGLTYYPDLLFVDPARGGCPSFE